MKEGERDGIALLGVVFGERARKDGEMERDDERELGEVAEMEIRVRGESEEDEGEVEREEKKRREEEDTAVAIEL